MLSESTHFLSFCFQLNKPTVYTCHIFGIPSCLDGHLGWLHFLVVNSASVDMDAQVSLGLYPGVEELAHMVILLIFLQGPHLISIMTLLIFIPSSRK